MNAVLFGTFTLRLSTGLTGALLTYHLAHFERIAGHRQRGKESARRILEGLSRRRR